MRSVTRPNTSPNERRAIARSSRLNTQASKRKQPKIGSITGRHLCSVCGIDYRVTGQHLRMGSDGKAAT